MIDCLRQGRQQVILPGIEWCGHCDDGVRCLGPLPGSGQAPPWRSKNSIRDVFLSPPVGGTDCPSAWNTLGAIHELVQCDLVEQPDGAAFYLDEIFALKSGEQTTHGLQVEPQVAPDLVACQPQHELA